MSAGADPATQGAIGVGPLTPDQVSARVADGRSNRTEHKESRSVAGILRANLLTRFNAIISVMVVVILIFGHPIDAMFGIVMVVNALIGIVQELRAKYTLDRLTLLIAPKAMVDRSDGRVEIPAEQVVLDDVVVVSRGQSVPVDGRVIDESGLEVSESLLTGEADPIHKPPESLILSGSFVVAGTGRFVATAVGPSSYANRLAAEARKFTLARSDLAAAIDQILRIVTWLLVPTSALLLWSQLQTGRGLSDAVVAAVAGVVAMVPQGLVLLVSMAFAVAVIRLGQRNVLVQELPAVETLARVDVLCVDKTGTLTDGTIALDEVVDLSEGRVDPADLLASIGGADDDPNPTMQAIVDRFGARTDRAVATRVPFSSERKTSAVAFEDGSAWIVGAPDVVVPSGMDRGLAETIAGASARGRRCLLVASTTAEDVEHRRLARATPVLLLMFAERIRPDAAETVRYFTEQHVDLKVISGDSADTVAAVATATGVPGTRRVDGPRLPDEADARAEAVMATSVFGRVTPEQKRTIVRSLQHRGRVVAMTGDGVNDVLAVKEADLGIAMGSGTGATRAVSQIVLLDDRFASLPHVVAEGRRVVANMERVAALFLTKTVYATFLAIAIGFVGLAFPFLPRHLTLIGSLTIGIPAFLLSFEPREIPVKPAFLPRVLSFAVPAGLVSGIATFAVYGVSRVGSFDLSLQQSRTAATTMMIVLGLVVLFELIEPKEMHHMLMLGALFASYLFVLAVPVLRQVFELTVPQWEAWLVVAGVSVIAGFVMRYLIGVSARYVADRYGVAVS